MTRAASCAKMFVVTNASRGAVCEEVRQRSVDRRPSGGRFAVPCPLLGPSQRPRRHRPCRPSAGYWPRVKTWACESASVLHGAEVRLRKSAGNLRSILRQSKISRTMIPVGKYATGCQTNRLPRRRHPMDALQPIGSNLILRNFRIFLSENPSSCWPSVPSASVPKKRWRRPSKRPLASRRAARPRLGGFGFWSG